MSLSATDFISIYNIRKGMETSNALADSKTREKDHNDISKQVEEFLKLGRNIDVIENGRGSGKTDISPLTKPINQVLKIAIKNLKTTFGNDLDITQDMQTGKCKAIYKGKQIGGTKPSMSAAESAIRLHGLKDQSNAKARARNERKQISKTKAKNHDSSED